MVAGRDPLTPVRSGADLDPRHDQLLLHDGYTYLLGGHDGAIGDDPDQGLFDYDLRLLDRHHITVAGVAPSGAPSMPVHDDRWVGVLGVRPGDGTPE